MAAGSLLSFHMAAGAVGALSGAMALWSRKGSRLHRAFGNGFFLSMLGMTASGASLAFTYDRPDSMLVGALTFYLVATAWMTVVRAEGRTGLFEVVALSAVLAIAATALRFGLQAAGDATGLKSGVAAENFYAAALVALSFAAFDFKAILSGGVSGAQRIIRHLWRMGFAMFIATLSLFMGQRQLFPEVLREPALLAGPVVLVAGVTVFWLLRVRFPAGPIKLLRG